MVRCLPGCPWYVADPSDVAGFLPSLQGVKPITVNGSAMYAIPAKLENTWALRNNGHKVPAPILLEYNFPPNTFQSQKITSAFLTTHPRAFVLSDMGTGKTRSAAMALDWLLANNIIRRALIVAPLSTVGPVWGAELIGRFPQHKTRLFLTSTKGDKYDGPWRVGVINYHKLAPMLPVLSKDKLLDLILFDELAILRTARTKMWRAARPLCDSRLWVWGMTGSPTPNGPSDAWAQARLVMPSAVADMNFTRWRDLVEVKTDQYRYEPRPDATRHVHRLLQPAVRFRRSAVIELPPMLVTTRSVEMTAEQRKAYNDLKNKLIHFYRSGQVTAANAGVLLSKLLQVAAGVVYDDARNEYALEVNNRIGVVEEVIEQAPAKVLVFAGYRSVLRMLVKTLEGRWTVGLIDGAVPDRARTDLIQRFQDRADPLRVLVAHPGTMAHGLTLTEAATIIWYCPIMSRERFEQANARITRPGQRLSQLQVRIVGAPIDDRVYAMLNSKLAFQQQCLKLFEELQSL